MAAHDIRFAQGYSNSQVCSTTRFSLMTARFHYLLRGETEQPINSWGRGNPFWAWRPSTTPLPSLLKQAGYRTALIGKWHLGYPPHFGPMRSGYDEFISRMSGGVDYFTHGTPNG
ncbi:MAG: sulfatase-like hydrolase/transferase [Thiobacillus sp.]|nr:sulfatase-like hydrolase/transferase [Thiobacillus sp.]